MRFRQKFLGFTGGVMVSLSVGLLILGKDTAYLKENQTASTTPFVNGAAGIPMWTALVVILCGMANIVEAFEKPKRPGRSYYELPFSMTVFLANFAALAVSAVCMGLLSWSLYSAYLQQPVQENMFSQAVVGVYATIIVACCLIFILALMTMFIDCCINGFIGFGGPLGMPPPDVAHRESPYDTYNSRPAVLYK